MNVDLKGFLNDLFDFSFTRFITTKWIKLLFIVGIAFITLACLAGVISSIIMIASGDGILGKLLGLVVFFFCIIGGLLEVIGLRIMLELVVVIFRIEEHCRALSPGAAASPQGFPVMPPPGGASM